MAVFGCIVSWIAREPAAFAAAKKLGYGYTASIAFGVSVVAIWGLWCFVKVGCDMGMGMEAVYDSEETDKDEMVLPE
ncbi:hypothetical protein CcaverHIS641_0207910 [Cutaneotrichosporon cavernicola]|nr:hypothetical protein CcaverHIS641_0207910 [Cutaneotrichosporon cavernicola]